MDLRILAKYRASVKEKSVRRAKVPSVIEQVRKIDHAKTTQGKDAGKSSPAGTAEKSMCLRVLISYLTLNGLVHRISLPNIGKRQCCHYDKSSAVRRDQRLAQHEREARLRAEAVSAG